MAAVSVDPGRDAGMPYLRTFTEEVRGNGERERAAMRAGLRGTATPAR